MNRRGFISRALAALGLGALGGNLWARPPEVIRGVPPPESAYHHLWVLDFPDEIVEEDVWPNLGVIDVTLSSGAVYVVRSRDRGDMDRFRCYTPLPSRRLKLPFPADAFLRVILPQAGRRGRASGR